MVSTEYPEWIVLGDSVRGCKHKENQDAIYWSPCYPEPGKGGKDTPIVLAIADGHGSSIHFRSGKGSEIAVKVAISIINEFLGHNFNEPDNKKFSAIKNMAEAKLPNILVSKWQSLVKEDIFRNPFSEKESDDLKKIYNNGKSNFNDYETIAYGTTLLITAITKFYSFLIQIGDGDILMVYDEGNGKVEIPIKKDNIFSSNETTSLCMVNSWLEFKVHMKILDKNSDYIPSLILLSTDGYSNSYNDEQEFIKIGKDYLKRLKQCNGYGNIRSSLKNILSETSIKGSNDDITLGMIFRSDIISKNDELYENCDNLFRKKEFNNALECFNDMLDLDPSNINAYFGKGKSLFNLDRYKEAIGCFDKVLEINPKYDPALNNKGHALSKIGYNKKALECYDMALKLNPLDSDYFFNKGYTLHEIGDYEQALECYDMALKLNPLDSDYLFNKGKTLHEIGDYEQALECYDMALKLNPPNFEIIMKSKDDAFEKFGKLKKKQKRS